MEWQIVGYHAVEEAVFDEMFTDARVGSSFVQQRAKPMIWSHSPLAAIYATKKVQTRKLGGCVSDPDSAERSGTKGRLPKSPGKICTEALERPNYVVLRLQSKENMADMFAKSVFKAIPDSCAFEMPADAWDGFGHLHLPGEWILDFACLSTDIASFQ